MTEFRLKKVKDLYSIQRKVFFGWINISIFNENRNLQYIDNYIFKTLPIVLLLFFIKILLVLILIPQFKYYAVISFLIVLSIISSHYNLNNLHTIFSKRENKFTFEKANKIIEKLKINEDAKIKRIYYIDKESERYYKLKKLKNIF